MRLFGDGVYFFTAFRMIADDTTGVSSARHTLLLFGTFYVNKIPLLCRFGHSAMLEIWDQQY
jgi:hypothetical protein